MKTALFWVITEEVVIFTDVWDNLLVPSSRVKLLPSPDNGTESLSQNVGKKLPLLAS
jgi:hypothetical protein